MLNNSSLEDIDDVDVTCSERSIEHHHICRERASHFLFEMLFFNKNFIIKYSTVLIFIFFLPKVQLLLR